MAAQMKAHTLKQRLCFARQMRSLLKFMRNVSCAVGDFPDLPEHSTAFGKTRSKTFGTGLVSSSSMIAMAWCTFPQRC
jgi:hypothetical protein